MADEKKELAPKPSLLELQAKADDATRRLRGAVIGECAKGIQAVLDEFNCELNPEVTLGSKGVVSAVNRIKIKGE